MSDETLPADRFRIQGEFEPLEHPATYTAWPYIEATWGNENGVKEAEMAMARFISHVSRYEIVHMLVHDDALRDRALAVLQSTKKQVRANMKNIMWHIVFHKDIWMRDILPFQAIKRRERTGDENKEFRRMTFDGYGKKFPDLIRDNELVNRLIRLGILENLPLKETDVIGEGGGFVVNGRGVAVTSAPYLYENQRNPGMSRGEIEKRVKNMLEATKLVVLPCKLSTDVDTDGHGDVLIQWVSPDQILFATTSDAEHPDFEALKNNERALANALPNTERIALPLPKKLILPADEGCRLPSLPVSYTQAVIGNDYIIVPFVGDAHDTLALRIYAELFPDKEVIGVDATAIFQGGGGFHCITRRYSQPR